MSAGQQQNGHDGAAMDILYVAGGIFLVVVLIVWFFHDAIVHALFVLKYYELEAVSMVLPQYRGLALWVHNAPVDQVTLLDVAYVAKVSGDIIRYPLALIVVLLMALLYWRHPDKSYRSVEDMQSLSVKMQKVFPASQIVAGLDLINTSIDDGPWAMALTPIEFAKRHKLMYRETGTLQIKVDRLKAKMVFSQQLGRPWRGLQELLPHERAIFGILAAYINYNRKDPEALLEKISSSVTQDKLKNKSLDLSGAEVLIAQYADSKVVQDITRRHSFVLTVFISLLVEARKTGIVANSGYLWLKPIDRHLWYVLNNVGRKAVFIETGAVHGHWLAESKLGFAIAQPMVDEAVLGLEEAIQSRVIKGDIG